MQHGDVDTPKASNSDRMAALVESIKGLGPKPTVAKLQSTLEAHPLSPLDVQAWIRPDRDHYHRARVAADTAFELLVMTWLPGQSSVAHDHGGSVCAMRVIDGMATERSYRLGEDGMAAFESEVHFPGGSTIVGDDDGIHSVHNLANQNATLVTLHVYAPPLKDFRRFEVPMPPTHATSTSPNPDTPHRACVIGGGFSGACTAMHLLDSARARSVPMHLRLIDAQGSAGTGAAYGTIEASHLLNVPAGNMSARPDAPLQFLDWAKAHLPRATAADFLPRMLYGRYLRESLAHAIGEAATHGSQCTLHRARATAIERSGAGWIVQLSDGTREHADTVVIATGTPLPRDPLQHKWSGPRDRWIGDPWRPASVARIQPHESVAIIGSSLTAVDVALSLTQDGAKRIAPICMLSRNGWLPRPHIVPRSAPMDLMASVQALLSAQPRLRMSRLTRWLRQRLRGSNLDGTPLDWRSVIDGLRPHTATLWSRLDTTERARFLRHARALWDVHRHRTAPAVHAHIERLERDGTLRRLPCRLLDASAADSGVMLRARTRDGIEHAIRADWVVNCSGPAPNGAARTDPVVASLLRTGMAQEDPLGLGIHSDAHGRVLGANGQPTPGLLVVGTLRRPALWESTAVPELRAQAAVAAATIAEAASARADR